MAIVSQQNVNNNYDSWMNKALEIEEKEWYRPEPPQQDSDSHYKTELPQLIHDMIRQNLEVANTIRWAVFIGGSLVAI